MKWYMTTLWHKWRTLGQYLRTIWATTIGSQKIPAQTRRRHCPLLARDVHGGINNQLGPFWTRTEKYYRNQTGISWLFWKGSSFKLRNRHLENFPIVLIFVNVAKLDNSPGWRVLLGEENFNQEWIRRKIILFTLSQGTDKTGCKFLKVMIQQASWSETWTLTTK